MPRATPARCRRRAGLTHRTLGTRRCDERRLAVRPRARGTGAVRPRGEGPAGVYGCAAGPGGTAGGGEPGAVAGGSGSRLLLAGRGGASRSGRGRLAGGLRWVRLRLLRPLRCGWWWLCHLTLLAPRLRRQPGCQLCVTAELWNVGAFSYGWCTGDRGPDNRESAQRHRADDRAIRGRRRLRAVRRPAGRDRRAGAPDPGRRAGRRAARRHRHRQVGHHGVADRAAAAADAGHGAEQDAGRPAGQRAARDAAEQRGRVLRQLLRLLPARGLRPADRHLHREGLLGQRRGRAAAALGDHVAAHPARRRRGRHRVVHLRPGHAAGVRRPVGAAAGRAGDRARDDPAPAWSTSSTPATTCPSPAARSGCAATPSRSSRCTRSSRSASRCSATRSSGSTTCTRSPARSCARSRRCSSSRRRTTRPARSGWSGRSAASRRSSRSGWPSSRGRTSCSRRSGCACARPTTSR